MSFENQLKDIPLNEIMKFIKRKGVDIFKLLDGRELLKISEITPPENKPLIFTSEDKSFSIVFHGKRDLSILVRYIDSDGSILQENRLLNKISDVPKPFKKVFSKPNANILFHCDPNRIVIDEATGMTVPKEVYNPTKEFVSDLKGDPEKLEDLYNRTVLGIKKE